MGKLKILVVDDDEATLMIVKKSLANAGYEAITAMSGQEALNMVEIAPPDAIILDRKMPEMSGDEVLKKLKSNDKTSDIPVMMLTSENLITDVSDCLEMGARDYIVKPFGHDNLIVRVKNILR